MNRTAAAALLALTALLAHQPALGQETRNYNLTGILDGLLLNYDKRLRPNYGGEPVQVDVSMYVLDISSLSEKTMEFTIDFYLRQYWQDPRLSYHHHPHLDAILPAGNFAQHIWTPDTFVVNERRSRDANPLTGHQFVRIAPSGAVTRSIRMSVTASCPMFLNDFPMDQHLCALEFESYGYSMNDIRYKWKDGPSSLGVSFAVTLPQFKLIGYRAKEMEVRLTSGNYSRMMCEFQLARSLGPHLLHSYVPAGLVVVVAWATLWLERGSTARAVLAGAALLAMTALTSLGDGTLDVLNALDLYRAFCCFLVVAALLEYTLVCYMMKRQQANEARLKAIQQMAEEHNKEVRFEKAGATNGQQHHEAPAPALPSALPAAATIDKHARAILPVAFVAFNLIYWVIKVHIGGVHAADLILV